MKKILLILFCSLHLISFSQQISTLFERSGGTKTPTYQEIISWWKMIDARFSQVKMLTMGQTDAGFPLNLVVVSGNKDFDFEHIRKANRRIILINNGIHPGEPDGIDASMLLVRDIVANKKTLPANIVLAIIPVYNIGGCLNRSDNYRVDQNGPDSFGFRGNSQNLDLNRDFIKSDSRDARAFEAIFHLLDPDVLVDNHVSNGADYQHIMTLLCAQHSKLGGELGTFMHTAFEPGLYALMKQKGYDLVPYVNFSGETPESGDWTAFYDAARFSSGYASQWQTFAFMPETHMLKSYDKRVLATNALMESFIEFTSQNSDSIARLRQRAKQHVRSQQEFSMNWVVQKDKYDEVNFKGYEAGHKPSGVSQLPRLYYDRNKPYEKKIKFHNDFEPTLTVKKPTAYIIPQGWWKVIDLLRINKVEMRQLTHDSTIDVVVTKIEDYKTSPRQYEGHHLNSAVKISTTNEKVKFRKGDYYIAMNQRANRFLMEVLEPQNEDSYFAWNFFDPILGQKEGYSSYAFEDIAADYLDKHSELKKKLEEKRSADTAFAKSAAAQLDFVYKNSPYYEPDHMRYPVYKVKG